MEAAELDRQLTEVIEKGFDPSFSQYCADVFSSFSYAPDCLAAARRHAFYLRLFLEVHLMGESNVQAPSGIPGDIYRMVGEHSIEETLSSPSASGMAFCRCFVRNWCRYFSF